MIKFIDYKEGESNSNVFDGVYPYIHWVKGQQSTGLWYTLKLMIISDTNTIDVSKIDDENSFFWFVDYDGDYNKTDLNEIKTHELTNPTLTGTEYIDGDHVYYIYQILMVCETDTPGEYTETFNITSGGVSYKIVVGGDFYDLNEVLQINLGNRGTEIPSIVQKAFPESNIHEEHIDNILVNRKFKELISNYIDILDCRGSYKSLYNSLKWFEWGDYTKLYEVWKDEDNVFFEKELESILSEEYSFLLNSYKKTTHLSLITPLFETTDGFDSEKNPNIIPTEFANKYNIEDFMLKVSLLGAFFERYFMPIHLDLKRASLESMTYTNAIKVLSGTDYSHYNYHDDTGVVEIEMDHTVMLGNINMVTVGPNTVFGYQEVPSDAINDHYFEPIGVDNINDIDKIYNINDYSQADRETEVFFGQLKGGIGVVVPVTVRVPLEEGDSIVCETLTVWKNDSAPRQVQERRYYKAEEVDDNKYYATFKFNLLSTQEELVKFTLVLHSSSGHTWTAASSYQCIDESGSYLAVCKVTPKVSLENNFIDNMTGNPWGTQYNTIIRSHDYDPSEINPDDYSGPMISQFIPSADSMIAQYNQLILVENQKVGGQYDISWISQIENQFWVLNRNGDPNIDDDEHPHWTTLINKQFGEGMSQNDFNNLVGSSIEKILRWEYIFIPQLHDYTDLESFEEGKYVITPYIINQTDLVCVIPQFKKTLPVESSSIRWKFKNMSTLEEVNYNIPITQPLVANNIYKALSPGYWTITMYYRLSGSHEEHELIKNSAFIIKK